MSMLCCAQPGLICCCRMVIPIWQGCVSCTNCYGLLWFDHMTWIEAVFRIHCTKRDNKMITVLNNGLTKLIQEKMQLCAWLDLNYI